jgi:hypothetical protein
MPHIVRTIAESNPPTGAASRQLLGVRAAAIRGYRPIGR